MFKTSNGGEEKRIGTFYPGILSYRQSLRLKILLLTFNFLLLLGEIDEVAVGFRFGHLYCRLANWWIRQSIDEDSLLQFNNND